MADQLVICDHVDECPYKCMGASSPHVSVDGGCKAGHHCATVDAVVRCIPTGQAADAQAEIEILREENAGLKRGILAQGSLFEDATGMIAALQSEVDTLVKALRRTRQTLSNLALTALAGDDKTIAQNEVQNIDDALAPFVEVES